METALTTVTLQQIQVFITVVEENGFARAGAILHMTQSAVSKSIAKLEKDLAYQQKFLAIVRGKLSNERFTAHAPAAVIENERKKEADSLSKIESLESQLNALKNNL